MPGRVEKRGRYWYTYWGNRKYQHTTRTLAVAQLRVLRAVKHGWQPSRKRR